MADERLLLIRLGSLGDIVHTLPAAAALRAARPEARIEWVVESKWAPLLQGNPDLDKVVLLDRAKRSGYWVCAAFLRGARYQCAIDFQGLYKSACLAWLAQIPKRIGFSFTSAREAGAALFYTQRYPATGGHVVEQNLALAARLLHARASLAPVACKLAIPPPAASRIEEQLRHSRLEDFYLLSPGGGWRSKCWPAERYGQLHRLLAEKYGWRGMISFGPGERELAETVLTASGEPAPVILPMDLPELMAAMRRAKFVVAADTGPLHLAAALGTPVVGLYGPTDPARNGPYGAAESVVDRARPEERTYRRGREFAPAMLRISVDDVVAGIERRLGMR